MPRELRMIFFPRDELVDAMVVHNRTLKDKVIAGDVADCAVGEGPAVVIESRVAEGNIYRMQKVEAPVAFILEALIRYCLENNIMIPRAGMKSAVYSGGEICLQITIGMDR